MSKKDRKNNQKAFQKRAAIKDMKRVTLKKTLESIYNTVNLETKMSCNCVCCKIGCPQLNYSEMTQIMNVIWNKWSNEEKAKLICKAIEYFFKNEFEKFGIETLVKPCMLQGEDGLCKVYEDRQLACRLFGLWPTEQYNERVEKFAKAYAEYGLKKEDLPLFYQCEKVERIDNSVPLTSELIAELYYRLDILDKKIGDFTDLEIQEKHNYRSFHDWLLLKVFGEDMLSRLTTFMMAATKEQILDLIEQTKTMVYNNINVLTENVKNSMGE